MKKKLLLDLILFIIMFLIMNYSLTGGLLHEVFGIFVVLLFLIHLIYNLKWIKNVGKKLFASDFARKQKLFYLLDLIILITFLLCMISGILISKYLFLFLGTSTIFLNDIHFYTSYIFIGLIIFHIIFHFNLITTYIQNKLELKNKYVIKYLFIFLLTVFSVFCFKNLFISNTPKEVIDDKKDDTTTNDNIKDDTTTNDDTAGGPPTLLEYLSKLNCSGCGNRCALNAIKCGRGEQPKEEATQTYNELYLVNINIQDNNIIISSDGSYIFNL